MCVCVCVSVCACVRVGSGEKDVCCSMFMQLVRFSLCSWFCIYYFVDPVVFLHCVPRAHVRC